MKKALSIFGILAIIGLAGTPALAAPGHGHGMHGGHRNIHHGARHNPPPKMHHHHHPTGYVSVGGVLARHSYWRHPYGCNCRLGWHHHNYYHHHYPYGGGTYINVGIPIRF